MTDHFRRYGHTDEKNQKRCRYVMLRQDMKSYPIIIWNMGWAHKKLTTNKIKNTDDEFVSRCVHKSKCSCQWGHGCVTFFSVIFGSACISFHKSIKTSKTYVYCRGLIFHILFTLV